jgi:hypothetical protein
MNLDNMNELNEIDNNESSIEGYEYVLGYSVVEYNYEEKEEDTIIRIMLQKVWNHLMLN